MFCELQVFYRKQSKQGFSNRVGYNMLRSYRTGHRGHGHIRSWDIFLQHICQAETFRLLHHRTALLLFQSDNLCSENQQKILLQFHDGCQVKYVHIYRMSYRIYQKHLYLQNDIYQQFPAV